MAFDGKQILFYAESLYESALQNMTDGRFRVADIYATCAYGAANLLSNDPDGSGDQKAQAQELAEVSYQLSRQAYSMDRKRMLEPGMSGSEDEMERFKLDMKKIAKESFRRKKS